MQAERFLEALRLRYLADLPTTKVTLHPNCDYPNAELVLVPACHQETGRWSAFIDPTLVSMFADEPGLEMAPNLARQADMLASIKSIKGGDVQRVMALLQEAWGTIGLTRQPECPANHRDTTPCTDSAQPRVLTVGSDFSDPKSFLLAVMNDPTANAQDRIRAAKALLPYFEQAHQT